MQFKRLHKKVFLWWGRYWAIQWVFPDDGFSLGFRIEPRRPLLDLFIGPLTMAFGNHPVLTHPRTKDRHACRGFLIGRYSKEAVL